MLVSSSGNVIQLCAGFDGEEVAHEAIKVGYVCFLAEFYLHWSPILFIQFGLKFGFESHEYVVPNQVGLAQFSPSRVHALKN